MSLSVEKQGTARATRRGEIKPVRRGTSVRARQNLALILPLLLLMVARIASPDCAVSALASPWLDAVGMLLLGLGLAIRVVARQWKAERAGAGLVTDGIYGVVRHPLYLGSFLLWAGLCLILGDLILGAVVLGAFLVSHLLVVRREEEGLVEQFGAHFRRYRANVPALLPRIFRGRKTPASPGYDPSHRERSRALPLRPLEGVVRESDAVAVGLALPALLELVRWAIKGGSGPAWQPVLMVVVIAMLAVVWTRLKREYRQLIRRERARAAA